MGLPERARMALYAAVLKRQPDCYPARYFLARSLAAAGETEAAVKELRAARERRLDWWAPRWALAGYYYRERRPAEARRELEAVRRLAPELREAAPMLQSLARAGSGER
jgi:Flp pilus assembly protein TadD